MDYIPSVEDIVRLNILIHDIDLFDGAMVGELARRSIKNTRRLFNRYDIIVIFVT